MKRAVVLALVFALAFGILASWLGPKAIAYWYAPPVPAGVANALYCTDAVTWAMNRLLWTQLIGSAVGAVVGVVAGRLWRRKPAATPPPRPGAA